MGFSASTCPLGGVGLEESMHRPMSSEPTGCCDTRRISLFATSNNASKEQWFYGKKGIQMHTDWELTEFRALSTDTLLIPLRPASTFRREEKMRSLETDLQERRFPTTHFETLFFPVSSLSLFFSHGLHTSRRLYLRITDGRHHDRCLVHGSPHL